MHYLKYVIFQACRINSNFTLKALIVIKSEISRTTLRLTKICIW